MRYLITLAAGLLLACAPGSLPVTLAGPRDARPELVLQAPPESSVLSVAVSPCPEGARSLVASDSFDGRVRLYDARTGAMLRAIDTGGGRGVAFAPDGRSLACAGYHMDKLVGVYDVRTGKRLQALAGHTELETYAIAFSPDGKLLASAGTDKQILMWDLATGALRHRLSGQPFPVTALAFSPCPEGTRATLASGGGDRAVRLWDAASGHLRRSLEGHRDWVSTVAFSPDGRTLASGSCDWAFHRGRNTVFFAERDPGSESEWKLWDVATGELKRAVSAPGRLLSLAFSPSGKSLACGIGKDVRVYDLSSEASGRVVTRHDFDVTAVAFSRDGAAVISGSHDQTVKRVALATGKTEWQAPGYFEQVNSVALSRDGSILATGSSDGRYAVRVFQAGAKGLGPGAVGLWDARTGRLVRRLGDPAEQVMAVALSREGRLVAAGGGSPDGGGVVHIWDAKTGAPVWSMADHAGEVLAVAFSPDGSSFASAGAEGMVRVRDAKTGAVVRTMTGHEGGATSLAFSTDGETLVCGEGQGGTRVWEVRTGRLRRTCKAAASQAGTVTTDRMITSVALSPDGATFAACAASVGNTYGEPVRLWDTRTGELKREFNGTGGRPIALSPDGAILATGGKVIRLWDLRTGKLLRELIGHLKKTQSIAFSADGRLIFGGGSYGTTNAWEVATGRHLVTLFALPRSGKGTVADDWLAYHPDGYYHGSPGVDRYLAWRVGDELLIRDASFVTRLHRPDRVRSALQLDLPKPASR